MATSAERQKLGVVDRLRGLCEKFPIERNAGRRAVDPPQIGEEEKRRFRPTTYGDRQSGLKCGGHGFGPRSLS